MDVSESAVEDEVSGGTEELLAGAEDKMVDAIDWTERGFGIGNCRLSPLTSGEGTNGEGDWGAKMPSSVPCS